MAKHIDSNTNELSIVTCIDKGASIFFKRPFVLIVITIVYFIVASAMNAITFFGQIASLIVLPIMSLGLTIAAHNIVTDKPVGPGVLFSGFKGQLSDRLIISFAFLFINTVLLSIYIGISYFIIKGKIDDGSNFFNSWTGSTIRLLYLNVIMFPAFAYVQIVFLFALMHNYFRSLIAIEAIKAALAMVNDKLWKLIALSIVLLLLNGLGAALLVGLLATIPISFAALYVAFVSSLKLELDTDLTD